MLTFTLTRTGHAQHCLLTGPMGDIVTVEFTNRTAAALFAQILADGHPATLSLVNERGGYEGYREIPPAPGVEAKPGPTIMPNSTPVHEPAPFSMLTLTRYQQSKQNGRGGTGPSPRGPRMRS